jgi:hypothetical protein
MRCESMSMMFWPRPPGYQASTRKLAGGVPASAQSFQPTATAVQAVHVGAASTRAALSARTGTTRVRIAEADALYIENEAESAAKFDAVGSQGV